MSSTLIVLNSNGKKQCVNLKQGVNTIGRRPECDVRIPMMLVSREHCRIIEQDDKIVVEDLGSSNGTFINSKRIMEGVVEAGDKLSIGPVTFMVQVNGFPDVPLKQEVSDPRANNDALLADKLGQSPSHQSDTVEAIDDMIDDDFDDDPLIAPDPLADFD